MDSDCFVQCKHLHSLYGVELFAVNRFSKASYNITQNSVTLSGELLDSAVGKKTCELSDSSTGEEDV